MADELSHRDPFRVLPLGTLHPASRCHYCGARGGRRGVELEEFTLRATMARAMRCVGTRGCRIRSAELKQQRLFG